MGARFIRARFHIDFGPEALFDRIHYKMDPVRTLEISERFVERAAQRRIAQEVLDRVEDFGASDWELTSCEVRVDTGKFVSSTWETEYDGRRYWLAIGLGNAAEAIERRDPACGDVVKDGDLYDYVRAVNRGLMADAVPSEGLA